MSRAATPSPISKEEGFVSGFTVRNRHRDNLTSMYRKEIRPDGASTDTAETDSLRFNERLVIVVINHDTGQTDEYLVRNSLLVYGRTTDGTYGLAIVVPRPDKARYMTRMLNIYTPGGDGPIDHATFRDILTATYPPPPILKIETQE